MKQDLKRTTIKYSLEIARDRIADAVLKGDLKNKAFLVKLHRLQTRAINLQNKLKKFDEP